MRPIVVLGTLAILAAVLPSGFAEGGVTCNVSTSATAIPVGPLYVQGIGSYWEETNGLAGLQMKIGGCNNGTTIPADQCILLTDGLPASVDCPLNALGARAGAL